MVKVLTCAASVISLNMKVNYVDLLIISWWKRREVHRSFATEAVDASYAAEAVKAR